MVYYQLRQSVVGFALARYNYLEQSRASLLAVSWVSSGTLQQVNMLKSPFKLLSFGLRVSHTPVKDHTMREVESTAGSNDGYLSVIFCLFIFCKYCR